MGYALVLEKINKSYSAGIMALRDICLTVEAGDFYALLGANGAGKSTLIGIVSSLIRKDSGCVKIFGKNLDTDPFNAKKYLGLVPQEFNFNPFETVFRIIVNQAGFYGVPCAIARLRAEFYLNRLDLWDKKDVLAKNLSGGMKRRLMLVKALIHRPQVLILDEPTAGVDIELRRMTWELLKELNSEAGTTVILTTHYFEEAEALCRNVAILKEGRLLQTSSIKTLLAQSIKETLVLDLSEKFPDTPPHLGVDYRVIDPYTLEVDIVKSEGYNLLFESLTKQGMTVKSLKNKTNRLEELFISLMR